jgi:chromosome segregation ATPase
LPLPLFAYIYTKLDMRTFTADGSDMKSLSNEELLYKLADRRHDLENCSISLRSLQVEQKRRQQSLADFTTVIRLESTAMTEAGKKVTDLVSSFDGSSESVEELSRATAAQSTHLAAIRRALDRTEDSQKFAENVNQSLTGCSRAFDTLQGEESAITSALTARGVDDETVARLLSRH